MGGRIRKRAKRKGKKKSRPKILSKQQKTPQARATPSTARPVLHPQPQHQTTNQPQDQNSAATKEKNPTEGRRDTELRPTDPSRKKRREMADTPAAPASGWSTAEPKKERKPSSPKDEAAAPAEGEKKRSHRSSSSKDKDSSSSLKRSTSSSSSSKEKKEKKEKKEEDKEEHEEGEDAEKETEKKKKSSSSSSRHKTSDLKSRRKSVGFSAARVMQTIPERPQDSELDKMFETLLVRPPSSLPKQSQREKKRKKKKTTTDHLVSFSFFLSCLSCLSVDDKQKKKTSPHDNQTPTTMCSCWLCLVKTGKHGFHARQEGGCEDVML